MTACDCHLASKFTANTCELQQCRAVSLAIAVFETRLAIWRSTEEPGLAHTEREAVVRRFEENDACAEIAVDDARTREVASQIARDRRKIARVEGRQSARRADQLGNAAQV